MISSWASRDLARAARRCARPGAGARALEHGARPRPCADDAEREPDQRRRDREDRARVRRRPAPAPRRRRAPTTGARERREQRSAAQRERAVRPAPSSTIASRPADGGASRSGSAVERGPDRVGLDLRPGHRLVTAAAVAWTSCSVGAVAPTTTIRPRSSAGSTAPRSSVEKRVGRDRPGRPAEVDQRAAGVEARTVDRRAAALRGHRRRASAVRRLEAGSGA